MSSDLLESPRSDEECDGDSFIRNIEFQEVFAISKGADNVVIMFESCPMWFPVLFPMSCESVYFIQHSSIVKVK